MQFIARWFIYAYPKRFSEPETRYESEPLKFEKDSVRAAKAHVTKLVKADSNMATLKEDKYGFGPYPPDWEAWSEEANYLHQEGVRYSSRLSQSEFESNTTGKDGGYSSTTIQAQIYLHWKEENEEIQST